MLICYGVRFKDYNRLEQQTLRIQGSKDVGSERRGAGEKGDSPANVAPGGGTPCKVRGLPKGTSKAHLISHFESCRRHAGGPVADVDIDQERGTATVIFESAEGKGRKRANQVAIDGGVRHYICAFVNEFLRVLSFTVSSKLINCYSIYRKDTCAKYELITTPSGRPLLGIKIVSR